jgi:hypothetical protein
MILKSTEECNPWYTGSIQRGLGGRGEEREKIRKTNHSRGQPSRSLGEKCKKEQMEKFLMGPRLVLKAPFFFFFFFDK